MRVLVTGGAGYVGATLVPLLLTRGHQVRVLDALRAGGHGLLPACTDPHFEFVRGDVCDDVAMTKALEDIDAIVHLAALVGYPACKELPALAQVTNVEGTKALLAARSPDQRIIFASTTSVYGKVTNAVCTEATPAAPVTLYGRTKEEAEQLVMQADNAVALRCATAFGVSSSMRWDLLLNNFVYNAVHHGSVIVYEAGHRRSFVHVRDIARCIVFALDNWSAVRDEVFNVGAGTLNYTKGDIARVVRGIIPYYLHFAEIGTDDDQRDSIVSFDKLTAAGFEPSVDLASGLAELVRAAKLVIPQT